MSGPRSLSGSGSGDGAQNVALPRQTEPLAIFTHAPTTARALQQRASARNVEAQLSGQASSVGAAANVDTSAAFVILLHPAHRWAQRPQELCELLRQLLRGHLRHWTVLIYSSRAKALLHCTNLLRSPLRPSDPLSSLDLPPALMAGARKQPLRLHALVTTAAAMDTLHQLARPLHLPLVYLGSDPRELAALYASSSETPYATARLDQMLAWVEGIRTKNEKWGGERGATEGGIGRPGGLATQWPYPSLVPSAASRLYRERNQALLDHWAESTAVGEALPPSLRRGAAGEAEEEDPMEERPDTPGHLARREARVRAQLRREKEEEEKGEEGGDGKENAQLNWPLTASTSSMAKPPQRGSGASASHGGHAARHIVAFTAGLPVPAATSELTSSSTAGTAPPTSLGGASSPSPTAATASPTTAQGSPLRSRLSMNVPSFSPEAMARAHRIQLIDEKGETTTWKSPPPPVTKRPSSSGLASSQKPGGHRLNVRPSSASSPSPSPSPRVRFSASTKGGGGADDDGAAPLSSSLTPRTIRNPFGTVDGLPSPRLAPDASTGPIRRHPHSARSAGGHPLGSARGSSTSSAATTSSSSSATATTATSPKPRPIQLFAPDESDALKLAEIDALVSRLQSHPLPPTAEERARALEEAGFCPLALPADTMEERLAPYAAQLAPASRALDSPTRRRLLAERVEALRALPTRDLFAAEQRVRGVLESKAQAQRQWERAHASSSANPSQEGRHVHDDAPWSTTRDGLVRVERDESGGDRRLSEFLSNRPRAYRMTLVEQDRLALAEAKRRATEARIREFNEAQSTARQVALRKVPDAPHLTHLQAVFLSPKPRDPPAAGTGAGVRAGAGATHPSGATATAAATATTIAAPKPRHLVVPVPGAPAPPAPLTRSTPPSASSPSVSLSSLGGQHRPTRQALEAALRLDYASLALRRREQERQAMQLEAVVWAQGQRLKAQAQAQGQAQRGAQGEEEKKQLGPREQATLRRLEHESHRERAHLRGLMHAHEREALDGFDSDEELYA